MSTTPNLTEKIKNNQGVQKIKRRFDEDPITVLLVSATVATAAAKLFDTFSAAQGRRAYAKQINHKVKKG